MFQFWAKSDNIYYVYLQSGQNHTLIPPPLEVTGSGEELQYEFLLITIGREDSFC